ncbi:MAG: hypothetical protein SPH32_01145 [Erysipelotrichaceae bacterium]|nr:hypothetical protein [Erysipelotrichaceae bacterium]
MRMRLVQTLKVCLIFCMLTTLAGCQHASINRISLAKWFETAYELLRIQKVNDEYLVLENMADDSYYYHIIQGLAAWNILLSEDEFDIHDDLTNEYLAKTILRINQAYDHDYLQKAYEQKIISSKDPDAYVDKQQALTLLKEAIAKRNDLSFEQKYEISYDPNIKKIETALQQGDKLLVEDSEIVINDIINYQGNYFEVIDTQIKDEGNMLTIKPCDPLELFEDVDIADSFDLDFRDAKIIDEGYEDYGMTSYVLDRPFVAQGLARPFIKGKTLSYQGYKIEINLSNAQVVVNASKKIANGFDQYFKFALNNVRPSFRYKMEDKSLKNAYFKVDFASNLSVGIKKGIAKDLYADFQNIDSTNFVSLANSIFKKQQDTVAASIPLGTISIPLVQMPPLNLVIKLQLNIYASGRVELSIANDHVVGMETCNGNLRLISDHDNQTDFVMKANLSIMNRTYFSLNAANLNLMDVYVELGIKGLIQSQIHIYDSNNDQTILKSDLPLDFLDEASQEAEDVLVCGDIKAYLVLNAGVNSDNSLLGRLNFKKNFNILNENNAPLINNGKFHIENWHFVDKCTRGKRPKPNIDQPLLVSDKITIKDYSLIVAKGKQIKINIVGLPKGYTLKDLKYRSDAASCLSVNDQGIITGIQRGSGIVEIYTSDEKYHTECHVLIKGEQV